MASNIFIVTLQVDARRLPTVLEALSGAATLVSVTPCQEAKVADPNLKKEHFFRDGKRNKGISGHDLVLELLRSKDGKPTSFNDIAKAFVERGFVANSASPALSNLKKEGKIRALGNGRYVLAGTTIKMGASAS